MSSRRSRWRATRVRFGAALLLLPLMMQSPGDARGPATTKDSTWEVKRVLIKPRPVASHLELDRLHGENRCEVLRQFPSLGGLQVLRVPAGTTVRELVRKYQASPLVEYAEPDYPVRLAGNFPNDPAFVDGTLWGLNNAGQGGGIANADIDAPETWAVRTSASNIVVAVVDTGIRYTHQDLASNMWVNPQDGSHGIDVLAGTTNPYDDNGHGTRLAGVIGAVGNNGLGVAGVAWQIQLMACKFVDQSGNGSISDALVCLDYARTNGARIINASWGLDATSLSLSNAMVALRAAGIQVVAAAGNNARDIDAIPYYPASFDLDNIIVATATTRQDALYSLSNLGPTNVDLAAPGYEIFSTDHASDNAYALDEGTSMAAAYTTGALALLRAAHPAESPAQIINRLLTAVDPLTELLGNCVSGGRLNLRRAMGVAISPPLLRIGATSSSGSFVLLLTGNPGRNYVVETGTNLLTWSPMITNLTGLDGTMAVTNGIVTDAKLRFYRARLLP